MRSGRRVERSRQNCGEPRALLTADISSRDLIVIARRRLRAVDARAPFDFIQVYLQNAALPESQFRHRYQCGLHAFAEEGASGSEEQIFYKLLRDRGSPARAARAFRVVFRRRFRSGANPNPLCW